MKVWKFEERINKKLKRRKRAKRKGSEHKSKEDKKDPETKIFENSGNSIEDDIPQNSASVINLFTFQSTAQESFQIIQNITKNKQLHIIYAETFECLSSLR